MFALLIKLIFCTFESLYLTPKLSIQPYNSSFDKFVLMNLLQICQSTLKTKKRCENAKKKYYLSIIVTSWYNYASVCACASKVYGRVCV